MKTEYVALTIDKFLPIVKKELSLLEEFVWELIHNLNESKNTVQVVVNSDIGHIEKELRKYDGTHLYFYKKHPAINEIYIHSLYLDWRIVKFTYSKKSGYSYEVLFLN